MGIVTKLIATIFVLIIIIISLFVVIVFPRVATDFSVSFTVGADREEKGFEVPIWHDEVEIQVTVDSGSALWRARILDIEEKAVWIHTKVQGEQTSYTSDWIDLPSGQYNLIFETVGIGDLQANVKVTTKGGFW